jgi:hypothetical protein
MVAGRSALYLVEGKATEEGITQGRHLTLWLLKYHRRREQICHQFAIGCSVDFGNRLFLWDGGNFWRFICPSMSTAVPRAGAGSRS